MRISVLDFGSNTFHCVIADFEEDWKVVAYKRIFVQLGASDSEITLDAFERGMSAIRELKRWSHSYKVEKSYGIATEAIRRASNGIEFIEAMLVIFPMELKLIDGDTEAILISKGVRKSLPNISGRALIMDIGGGSVEFIIIDNNTHTKVFSFPVGILNLKRLFQKSDPMTVLEQEHLWNYLTSVLSPLFDYLALQPVTHLIGSSGTFDVLVNMLLGPEMVKKVAELPLEDAQKLIQTFQFCSQEEMYKYKGMMEQRVPFLAVASTLILFIIEKFAIQKITVSPYAMKEGVLESILQKEDIPHIQIF